MGKLTRLELQNFKSYRGHHVILLGDSYFTSIIGPNGSGKSNSMDAISFVLGIKASHLRSAHLSDLVFRDRVLRTSLAAGEVPLQANGSHDSDRDVTPEGATSPDSNDPKVAWVMAVYEDDGGDEQRWKRSITNKGVSEYRINGRAVSALQYNQALEAENILIKARNFLVFQGDVEAIASQSPSDLTRLIEQISGSLEFKPDYERLKAQSEEALEAQNLALQKRRSINSEIKQYSEQKTEVDHFVRKTHERDEAIVTHVLWNLFHFQESILRSMLEIQRQKEQLEEHQRKAEKAKNALEQAKKHDARTGRSLTQTEQQVRAKETALDSEQTALIPIAEKVALTTTASNKCRTRRDEIMQQSTQHETLLKSLRKELATVTKAQSKWERDYAKTAAQEGHVLSQDDLAEYEKLRDQFAKDQSIDQMKIDSISRQQKADWETVESLKSKVSSLEGKAQNFADNLEEVRQKRVELQELIKHNNDSLGRQKKTHNERVSERLRTAQLRDEKDEKLREVLIKLIEAEDGRQQSEKEVRFKAAVNDMKRNFPGVRGRVSELCRPIEKRYQTAVSTVLGRNFDAIIVDNEKTAVECITYLREQRRGQATFIPLETIQLSSNHVMATRHLQGCRAALDTIKFDQPLERAFLYVCGNAMICDDLATAKTVAWDKRYDAKAVTLDGSIIHKGGNMTGGRGAISAARRFDDGEVDALQTLQARLVAEISALPDTRRSAAEDESLVADINSLEHQIRCLQDEVDSFERNEISKAKELSHITREIGELKPEYETKAQENVQLEETIRVQRAKVDKAQDQIFSSFCKRLGIPNIRAYEASQGISQRKATQERLEFSTQKSKLESRVAYEEQQTRAIHNRVLALERREDESKDSLRELENEQSLRKKAIDVLEAELDVLQQQVEELVKQRNIQTSTLSERKRQSQQAIKHVDDQIKAISSLETDRQSTITKRVALLRRCKLENLRIPLTNNSKDLDAIPLDDLVSNNAATQNMDGSSGDTSAMDVSTADNNDDYGIELDFDELDEALQADASEARDAKLQDHISKLNQELTAMAPNMRAIERLNTVQEHLRNTDKEFESARKRAKQARDGFQAIKQKRFDVFNKAFGHISDQIGPIYKNLTRDSSLPMGGQAYLDVEDGDEPYLEGIKYHAMPPLKRFRDMEHLSGGEKTMAALALLFAIHSYQPSPFFVLDEVDAALDNANVSKIANYIRDHAGPGMQFIVISLKTGLFHNSEALVGVYRDQPANSSKTLTLDLRQYQ